MWKRSVPGRILPVVCLTPENAHISHTPAVRATQGQGLMPDKTSRFSINGQKIFHFVCVFIALFP
jgi:Zn-dependent alcohol dehydrogenase